jgi:hypothetical protein
VYVAKVMMCCLSSDADDGGPAGLAHFILHPLSFILRLFLLLAGPAGHAMETNGPTIQLHYGGQETADNPVAQFMYFVPLISREPVSSLTSPGSTQLLRLLSAKRRFSRHSFAVICEAEVTGQGWQQSLFDLAPAIQRNERQLQNGGSVEHQIKSIDVRGDGAITVEVEGAVSNGVATVREVRLRFNAHGHASPVSINMCDLRRIDGHVRPANEVLAQVNTLTFRRQPGPPTMEISVASIKHKEAGDSLWQNLKGRVAGAAVNLFLDPLTIQAGGQQAMLDFGQALVSGAPTFTFPRALNLQAGSAPYSNERSR